MKALHSTILFLTLVAAPAFGHETAGAGSGCLVTDAAQAALDREIELIKSLAVDPADSFKGPQSCINGDILNSFDLSTLIGDPAQMLSGFSMDSLNSMISTSRNKVCRQINEAIGGAIGNAQSAMGDFDSKLSDQLQGILDNGWGDVSL